MNPAARILRIFSCALVALVLHAESAAAAPNRDPLAHLDEADAAESPVDMRSISFGQRGTELVLHVTTAGEWEPAQLSSTEGRGLCISLFYGRLLTPRARICVFDKGANTPGLSYARLDPDAAVQRYSQLIRVRSLTSDSASPFALAVALPLAWQRDARAEDFFARVSTHDLDDSALEWRARAALC